MRSATPLRHSVVMLLTVAIGLVVLWATLNPRALPETETVPLDKLAHAAAFALLILPSAWGYPQALIVTVPAALFLGGAIELLQPLVGRGREMADFVMDVVGVGLGLVIGTGLRLARP